MGIGEGGAARSEAVEIRRVHLPRVAFEVANPITEVINQTANLSRLIDVLAWIIEERSDLNAGTVLACHPTTSSGSSRGETENDLTLALPDGSQARFEISDVSGDIDGNKTGYSQ